ncbi:MAG TPA: NUDIX hydrolase [Chthoniobacteraceae bacterium]|nr:NUDIX hydrolase [Chthoniobacteraceae bacterium]
MNFHEFIEDGPGWETLRTEQQFANPHVQVFKARIRTPTRPEGCDWTVVHRKGAAVIAPMTADGRFILVKQERVPIRATIWEFPAGQIDAGDSRDESVIRDTAVRELREEAGCKLAAGGELVSLGLFFTSCGFTDEHSHLFLARPVEPALEGHSPDEHEAITGCHAFTAGELRAMIVSGEIRDANTLCAYARMRAMGIL